MYNSQCRGLSPVSNCDNREKVPTCEISNAIFKQHRKLNVNGIHGDKGRWEQRNPEFIEQKKKNKNNLNVSEKQLKKQTQRAQETNTTSPYKVET